MSGLLIGIVAARVAGGVVGGVLGWRAVFAIAAALNASLAIIILRRAPASQLSSHTSYPALLRSVGSLVRRQRPLRVAMAFGFVSMASFNPVGSVTATALWSAGGWLDVVLAGSIACAAALGARMSRLACRGPDDPGLVWCPARGATGGGMTRDLAGHECPAKDSSPAAAIPRSP